MGNLVDPDRQAGGGRSVRVYDAQTGGSPAVVQLIHTVSSF